MIKQIEEKIIYQKGIELSEYLGEKLCNKESDLFVYEGNVVKIIRKDLIESRKEQIKFFHNNKQYFPIPMLDIYKEEMKIYGYSTTLYENIPTMYDFLWSNVSLKERKKLAMELLKLALKLEKNNLMFFDWHSCNFLVSNKLIFLDFDSCEKFSSYWIDSCRKALLELILSLLNGIDLDFDIINKGRGYTNLLHKLVNIDTFEELPTDFAFLKQEIKNYTEEKVNFNRELIIKLKF